MLISRRWKKNPVVKFDVPSDRPNKLERPRKPGKLGDVARNSAVVCGFSSLSLEKNSGAGVKSGSACFAFSSRIA